MQQAQLMSEKGKQIFLCFNWKHQFIYIMSEVDAHSWFKRESSEKGEPFAPFCPAPTGRAQCQHVRGEQVSCFLIVRARGEPVSSPSRRLQPGGLHCRSCERWAHSAPSRLQPGGLHCQSCVRAEPVSSILFSKREGLAASSCEK
jgi:hypothetical protein